MRSLCCNQEFTQCVILVRRLPVFWECEGGLLWPDLIWPSGATPTLQDDASVLSIHPKSNIVSPSGAILMSDAAEARQDVDLYFRNPTL